MKHLVLLLLFTLALTGGANAQLTFYGDCSTPINARPNNVSAQAVGHHKAVIRWQGVPGAKGYAVNVGLADIDPKGWPTFLTCDPNEEYTVEGLTPGQTYRARVRTLCGDCGKNGGPTVSPWSFVVEFTTPNDPQTPASPSNPVTNAPDPTPFDFDLSVKVVNRFYEPVAGAEVKVGSQTLTTDAKGEARANGLRGSRADRSLVSASHPDYLPQWRGFLPTGPALQYAQIMLTPKEETHGFMSDKGGTMTATGFWLTIPPDAVVDENGQPYTGRVGVQMDGVRPSDVDFGLRMPGGDFYALDASGQPSILYSYGFFGVELRGDAGQLLNLAAGKKATVRLLIDEEQRAEAPASVPLWHFDEAAGHWRHAGDFAREGKFYVAEVEHFSWWKCGYRGPLASVSGRVVNCDGSPAVGVPDPLTLFQCLTDAKGEFRVMGPPGVEFQSEYPYYHDFSTRPMLGPFAEYQSHEINLPFVAVPLFARNSIWRVYSVYATHFEDINDPGKSALEIYVNEPRNFYEPLNFSGTFEFSLDGGQTYSPQKSYTISRIQAPIKVLYRITFPCSLESVSYEGEVIVRFEATLSDCAAAEGLASVYVAEDLRNKAINFNGDFVPPLTLWFPITSMNQQQIADPAHALNRLDLYFPCTEQVWLGPLRFNNINGWTLEHMKLPLGVKSFRIGSLYGEIDALNRLPQNLNEYPLLKTVHIDSMLFVNPPDFSQDFPYATDLTLRNSGQQLNTHLASVSQMPSLKKLTLIYANGNSPTPEDINIPASFADLADTLEELDLRGCAPIDPAEQQRIQSLLPNTTIRW